MGARRSGDWETRMVESRGVEGIGVRGLGGRGGSQQAARLAASQSLVPGCGREGRKDQARTRSGVRKAQADCHAAERRLTLWLLVGQ